MRSVPRILLLVPGLGAWPALHASRSGLNNVPTADVSVPRVAVVHVYSSWGPGRDASFLTGIRDGFSIADERVEAGVDSRWKPGQAVGAFFHGKWARPIGEHAAVALGAAGAAPEHRDRRRLGQPQSYGVVTADFSVCRLSGGYALQTHNNAWFLGVDRKFTVFHRALVFRADAIEIQDRRHSLSSVGATYRFTPELALELWQNHPTGPARDYTTAKLAGYFKF